MVDGYPARVRRHGAGRLDRRAVAERGCRRPVSVHGGPEMMTSWLSLLLFVALMLPFGALAGDRQITSLEQLAGRWYGWQRNRSGYDLRVDCLIEPSGRVKM